MPIIDKVDFQSRITNRISHLDVHDQSMCRAVLCGMMIAMMDLKFLDVVWRSFDEWVGSHYGQTPTYQYSERSQFLERVK